MHLVYKKFKHVDLKDDFFNSLKSDYSEFPEWFDKKRDEYAYVFENINGKIDGFLYLKLEDGPLLDVEPPLPTMTRLKVGTFKVNAHGTKLGERFIKKIFDHAITNNIKEIYVTAFDGHAPLIAIFLKYGFVKIATKTTANGVESVFVKSMTTLQDTLLHSYPLIDLNGREIYTLSLYPEWHTRLLPDSILNNEDMDIVKDISHTNSIHKVYLAGMKDVGLFKPNDIILIYRTSDGLGPAYHRSVITSVCVIEEYRSIDSFGSFEDFFEYCRPYTVFSEVELRGFWAKRSYPHVIRFTYNVALKKRVTRKVLIEECGIDSKAYAGVMHLSKGQFLHIINKGQTNENFIID